MQLSATTLVQATVTIKMFVIPVLALSIARDINVSTASLGLCTSLAYIVCVFSALVSAVVFAEIARQSPTGRIAEAPGGISA